MKQAVEIENKHLFSKSDLKKLLIPLMIEQLLNSMMGMVDTVMVSNVGSAAISAVSLVDSINVLVIQLLSALAVGGTIVAVILGYKGKSLVVVAIAAIVTVYLLEMAGGAGLLASLSF